MKNFFIFIFFWQICSIKIKDLLALKLKKNNIKKQGKVFFKRNFFSSNNFCICDDFELQEKVKKVVLKFGETVFEFESLNAEVEMSENDNFELIVNNKIRYVFSLDKFEFFTENENNFYEVLVNNGTIFAYEFDKKTKTKLQEVVALAQEKEVQIVRQFFSNGSVSQKIYQGNAEMLKKLINEKEEAEFFNEIQKLSNEKINFVVQYHKSGKVNQKVMQLY